MDSAGPRRLAERAIVLAAIAVPLPLVGIWGSIALEEATGFSGRWALLACWGVAVVLGMAAVAMSIVALVRRPVPFASRPHWPAWPALAAGSFALAHAGFWALLAFTVRGAY